jgi:hypothetical protein
MTITDRRYASSALRVRVGNLWARWRAAEMLINSALIRGVRRLGSHLG